jgi:hypothetical protein
MSNIRESLTRFRSCVHFTGTQHERCAAGVRYVDVERRHEPMALPDGRRSLRVSIPCLLNENHGGATCDKLQAPSEQEFEAEVTEIERTLAAIDAGRSPCCDAPLDGSSLMWTDDGKASGSRYCTKCRKFVDRLCNPKMPEELEDGGPGGGIPG